MSRDQKLTLVNEGDGDRRYDNQIQSSRVYLG
ncbi:hypothetical protein AFCDBAGC_3813 [Methylobacterium cerastii]|uniref:Uncharacterized protein n=1 Tax=Methylobacterium cerastii TaxID=932741 RepID=A0ABQ4QLZ7_9HYPH|nr:hypothetical protein AFCDBAGC_3813 [Methylobacterium cerastii]